MFSFDLPAAMPPVTTSPVTVASIALAQAERAVFAEFLAGAEAGPAISQAATLPTSHTVPREPGTELPDAAEQPGNPSPDQIAAPVISLPAALPALAPAIPASGAPASAPPHPRQPEMLMMAATLLPQPQAIAADGDVSGDAPAAPVAAPDMPPADPAAGPPALPARASEPIALAVPQRDAPLGPPVASAAPPPAATPGAQLEQLVEVLAQAREAGKGARGDITVRHSEFGAVAIRLEQDGGETRAQLSGRDPGFAPAVVAALAERGSAGFTDQHQRGQDQSWGQHASAHSEPRQQDRRNAPAPDGRMPGRQPAANPGGDTGSDQPLSPGRHGRFA